MKKLPFIHIITVFLVVACSAPAIATPAIRPMPSVILVGNLERYRAKGSGTISLQVSKDGTSINHINLIIKDTTTDCVNVNDSTGKMGFGGFKLPLTGLFPIDHAKFMVNISRKGKLEGKFISATEAEGSVRLILEPAMFGGLHTCDFGTWSWDAKLQY